MSGMARTPTMKPTELLTNMRQLVLDISDDVLEEFWIKEMPMQMHTTLFYSRLSLDQKAEQADLVPAVQYHQASKAFHYPEAHHAPPPQFQSTFQPGQQPYAQPAQQPRGAEPNLQQ